MIANLAAALLATLVALPLTLAATLYTVPCAAVVAGLVTLALIPSA